MNDNPTSVAPSFPTPPEKFDISRNYNRRVSGSRSISDSSNDMGQRHTRRRSSFECDASSESDSRNIENSEVIVVNGKRYSYCGQDISPLEDPFFDRESHTSDLFAFDEFVERLQRTDRIFLDRPFHAEFWAFIRSILCQATGVGYEGLEDSFASDHKGPNDCMAFLGKLMATGLIHPLQPKLLAMKSGIDEDVILTELFYASRIGMMSMLFGPDCRRCGTLVCMEDRLSGLPRRATCAGCRIDNSIQQLDKVKVVFRFNEEVLYVRSENFPCQPSSASMAENILFAIVPSSPTGSGIRYSAGCGEDDMWMTESLKPGRYRMHCPVACADAFLVVQRDATPEDTPYSLSFHVSDIVVKSNAAGGNRDELVTLTAPHGKIFFDVFNDTANYFVLWIQNDVQDDVIYSLPETERFPFTSVTDVMHHPLFGYFFSDQVVRRANKFEIENVVLVFTDVVGSTNMYSSLGDGDALDIVTQHFEILFEEFANHGRVVKTIGDAVMGSFTSGLAALEAVSNAMATLRRECIRPDGTALEIRVVIHAGPAVVVPVNGVNDYFGQTVNVAARVESAAEASSVYVSNAVFENDSAALQAFRDIVEDDMFENIPLQRLSLKGVQHPVDARGFRLVGPNQQVTDEKELLMKKMIGQEHSRARRASLASSSLASVRHLVPRLGFDEGDIQGTV